LQDIVQRPASAKAVVGECRLEGERSEKFALLGDDANVGARDQQSDPPVLVRETEADVSESAEVTSSTISSE